MRSTGNVFWKFCDKILDFSACVAKIAIDIIDLSENSFRKGILHMGVKFDDSFVIGNAKIDSQHRELIARIDKLLILCENEKPAKREAVQMLDYLEEYTDFHFAEEEELQEKVGYPGIEEHKKKHQELRDTVKQLHEMLEEQEGPTDEFVQQVEEKVMKWLYQHIKGFDRSVAEYVNLRGNENLI